MRTRHQPKSHKFVSDVVWVGVAQVLMSLTGLVVLPALTKNYQTQVYGLWSQMLVTVSLLGMGIMTIQFDSATVRFLAGEEDRDKRGRAFGTMLWPILAFNCLIFALSLLFRQSLSKLLFTDTQYVYLVSLVFLWASVESLFIFSLSYLRARGKIKKFSVIRLASSIARMLLIVSLVSAGYSFHWLVGSVIAVQALLVAMIITIIIWETGLPQFGFAGLKSYISYSVPLIPGAVLSWIIDVSDRFLITHFLNISQTGIYSASYVLASMMGLLIRPIGMVLFPFVSKFWEQGEFLKVRSYFHYSMKLFLTLAIPAAVGLYILSQPLLGILSTSEFIVGGTLVLLVALGFIFGGIVSINRYIIFLTKKTVWLPVISFSGATINVVVNIVLIPRIGIMGAAISTLISYFVISIVLILWGRKEIGYELDFKFLAKVILATAIMAGCLRFIEISNIIGILLVMVIGVIIYGLGLFLLRAFSKEDRRLIKEALSGLRIGIKLD